RRPTGGCSPWGGPSGVAEVKVQAAVAANALLKIKAVSAANQFGADVQGLGHELPYKVTTFAGSSEVAHAFFFTDAAGQADVDIKGLSNTCDIKTVKVTKFGTSIVVLQGTFGVDVDPPEVQIEREIEIQNELQVEAEAELNDLLNP